MEIQTALMIIGIINAGAVLVVGYVFTDLRSRIVRLENTIITAFHLKVGE
jgi:hypothetical protein